MSTMRLSLSPIQKITALEIIVSSLDTFGSSSTDYENACVQGFVITQLANMAAEMDDLITTQRSSDLRVACMAAHARKRLVALSAILFAAPGAKGTYFLERWNPTLQAILPDMLQNLTHPPEPLMAAIQNLVECRLNPPLVLE